MEEYIYSSKLHSVLYGKDRITSAGQLLLTSFTWLLLVMGLLSLVWIGYKMATKLEVMDFMYLTLFIPLVWIVYFALALGGSSTPIRKVSFNQKKLRIDFFFPFLWREFRIDSIRRFKLVGEGELSKEIVEVMKEEELFAFKIYVDLGGRRELLQPMELFLPKRFEKRVLSLFYKTPKPEKELEEVAG